MPGNIWPKTAGVNPKNQSYFTSIKVARGVYDAVLDQGGGTSYILTASCGSFTVSGFAALFRVTVPYAGKLFNLSGGSAAFSLGYVLAGSAGSFTLSGNKALFSMAWPANYGSFTETGGKMKFGLNWKDGYGSFVLTGNDASLTYAPSTGGRHEWSRRNREMLASRGRGI